MDKDEMIVKEEEIISLNSDDSDLAAADADVSFASTDDKEVLIKIEPKDDYELPEIQQVDPTARELKEDANGNTHFMAYQDPTSATTHSGSGTFGGGLSRNVTHPSSRANMYPGLSHQGRAQEDVQPQEVLNLKGSG